MNDIVGVGPTEVQVVVAKSIIEWGLHILARVTKTPSLM
jgi:hypothetical protein